MNETAEVILGSIDKLLSIEKAKSMSKLLYTACYFLKHKYKHHTVLNNGVCYHGLLHVFSKKTVNVQQMALSDSVATKTNTAETIHSETIGINTTKTNTAKMNTTHDTTTTTDNKSNGTTLINVNYNVCKFPYFLCSTIKKALKSSSNHTID